MVALHGSLFDRNLNGKDKIVGRHWCPVLLVVHLSLAASSLHSQWRCHVPSGVRQSRSINTFCPAPNSSPLLKVACANDLPAFLHECDLAGVEPVELEPIVLTITAAGDRAFLVAAARTWNSATACHLSILCVSLQSSPEDLSLLSVISRIIVKYRRSDI